MSKTFSNQGNYAFKKITNIKNSSDYLQNKKANLLLNNSNQKTNKQSNNQSNYLFFEKAKFIKNNEESSNPNANDIVTGLCSHVHLGSSVFVNNDDLNFQDTEDDFNEDDDDVVHGKLSFNPVIANVGSNKQNANTIDIKSIYPNKKTVPFYYKYRIDQNGVLFGNTPSDNNYKKFRFLSKQ
jgi:hypothetical protein